jgi:hypothetical protein
MDLLPESSDQLADMVCAVLNAHGVVADRYENHVSVPDHDVLCELRVFSHSQSPTSFVIQADLRVEAPALGGRTLVESLAGYGATADDAVKDAFRKLCLASVHVLLAGVINPGVDTDQVNWEDWSLPQGEIAACLGSLLVIGPADATVKSYAPFLNLLRERHVANLDAAIHWIRVYYCASEQGQLGGEVMLDNEPWPEAQDELARFDWPAATAWHSIRHFFMVVPQTRRN